MKVDSFKCDGCGIQKGETNHWFRGCFDIEGIMFSPWIIENWYRAVLPVPVQAFPKLRPEFHFCSDACVIKAVQQWLSAQKNEVSK